MQIIRAADCRRMPWKNGGGETVEIAVFPDGAGLDGFVWRLSAARVARDGPFSVFPGIDRTLAVLSGQGLELRVAGESVGLGPEDAPRSFPGDVPAEARLLGGSVDDLNVMTRRGVVRHRMRRVAVNGAAQHGVEGATVLVFCAEGHVRLGDERLGPRDTAVLAEMGCHDLDLGGAGTLYVVEIRPASKVDPRLDRHGAQIEAIQVPAPGWIAAVRSAPRNDGMGTRDQALPASACVTLSTMPI